MLEHGGRLHEAVRRYGIPREQWLDLSTGINPRVYPIPPIDPACWNRLPEDDDGLEAAAAAYYKNERLLLLAGSQAAIQTLPALFRPAAVACVSPMYEEHPQAWQHYGHKLRRLPGLARALAAATPVVVLCNPNNPTATTIPRGELLEAAAQLNSRGGWLVVDEAFADHDPENCVTPLAGGEKAPNLITLRSLGKFFGLAGARVGALFAAPDVLERLRERLGPWPIANPSRAVARQVFEDQAWQAESRHRLITDSLRLKELLHPLGDVRRTALFCTVQGEAGAVAPACPDALFEHFARRAILIRRFETHRLLRFGLPGNEAEWQKLSEGIAAWEAP